MPSRRTFLKQNSIVAFGAWAVGTAPFVITEARSEPAAPVADTTCGKLRGRTENGIHVFRGVPYGADTSGKNRFMPPQKPASWQGARDVVEWGRSAPQPLPDGNYDYTRAVRWAELPGGTGEDCLVLNVWTPALRDGGKRAVMVSIHGGGFTSGTSNNPVFDGGNLARKYDVVVVTVNHRLGALGFLDLGEFAPEFAQSGVVGLMDLVAALEWLRDNIENFGGDPAEFCSLWTIGGGGSKVCHLMAMPSAKGLFQRAAVESGAALRSGTRESATQTTERLLATTSPRQSPIPRIAGCAVRFDHWRTGRIQGAVWAVCRWRGGSARSLRSRCPGNLGRCSAARRQQSPGQQSQPD